MSLGGAQSRGRCLSVIRWPRRRHLVETSEQKARRHVAKAVKKAGKGRGAAKKKVPPKAEIKRWVADKRARRVPNFVIEQTGLKTKKKIVEKYGNAAVFEKGKPAPKGK